MPPEPAITEFNQWVPWRANRWKIPSWWTELLAVPEVGDHKRLARKVWASFWLPQKMRELRMKEANLQVPLVPPCLHRQKFMPPAKSIYASRDIREIPQEKVGAYARALKHWVEKIDPHAEGRPCLLAKGMKELREEVKCYLSFSDEEVFQGMALPKEEDNQSLETTPTDIPKTPCALEPAMEGRGPKFLGWEKILHPSWPVVTAGEISCPSRALRPRGGPIQLPQAGPSKPPTPLLRSPIPSKSSSPIWALAVVWPTTPPCDFAGMTACLWTQEPSEMASEAPHDTLSIGVVMTPGISTMSMSIIIRDEAMGVAYMDMVTTSIGRVALSHITMVETEGIPTQEKTSVLGTLSCQVIFFRKCRWHCCSWSIWHKCLWYGHHISHPFSRADMTTTLYTFHMGTSLMFFSQT